MGRWTRLFAAAFGCLLYGQAQAEDLGPFLGVAWSDVSWADQWQVDPRNLGPAAADAGFRLVGGLRPLDAFAVELEYADLGESRAEMPLFCPTLVGAPCPRPLQTIEATGFTVSAVGLLKLNAVDLFARAGISRWDLDRRSGIRSTPASDSGTDAALGVGAQYRINAVSLRFEYEQRDLADIATESLSLGLTYTFSQ